MARSRSFALLPLILALGGAAPVCAQSADGVAREGEGSRRTQLSAMELKAFPASAWDTLSEWKGGKALSQADTAGNPVLILTWSSWHPSGSKAISVARRMAAQYAKDGLVVVIAHHPDGFADAAAEMNKPAGEGQKIFFAHDAKGDFRKAILSDQDPDFYVIDRAGQLRFGDITTEAVDHACQIVCAETRDAAASINKQIADTAAEAKREQLKSGDIRDKVTAATIPEQSFTQPSEAEYKAVRWPKPPKDPNASSMNKEDEEPKKLALPDGAQFYPSRPATKGRGIVVYFWTPTLRRTYDGVIESMDQLQRSGGRDLAVIGVITPLTDANSNNNNNQEEQKLPDWNKMIRGRSLQHTMLPDLGGAVLGQVVGPQGTSNLPSPYAAVISSDGTVRYAGRSNAPGFQGAIEAILRDDPGVKARRAAEDQYLKSSK